MWRREKIRALHVDSTAWGVTLSADWTGPWFTGPPGTTSQYWQWLLNGLQHRKGLISLLSRFFFFLSHCLRFTKNKGRHWYFGCIFTSTAYNHCYLFTIWKSQQIHGAQHWGGRKRFVNTSQYKSKTGQVNFFRNCKTSKQTKSFWDSLIQRLVPVRSKRWALATWRTQQQKHGIYVYTAILFKKGIKTETWTFVRLLHWITNLRFRFQLPLKRRFQQTSSPLSVPVALLRLLRVWWRLANKKIVKYRHQAEWRKWTL